MKSLHIVLIGIGLLLMGCGGGSEGSTAKTPETDVKTPETERTVVDTTKNYHIAQDNTVHDLNMTFKTHRVVVYTDASIDRTSQSSKAIYGKINGLSTDALMSVNSNYVDGTAFIVKVFLGSTLVGESDKGILKGSTLKFSDISTK